MRSDSAKKKWVWAYIYVKLVELALIIFLDTVKIAQFTEMTVKNPACTVCFSLSLIQAE